MTKKEVQDQIYDYIVCHPDITYTEVAKKLGCSINTISRICRQRGQYRKRIKVKVASLDLSKLGEANNG